MKQINFLLTLFLAFALFSCSKEATDAANSDDLSPTTINGTWKEPTSGVVIRISGVTSTSAGKGVLVSNGTAFPSGAVGGTVLTEVEHQSGGYWDAYNWSYSSSGSWYQSSVVGMAMTSDDEFKIGSKAYKRQ